MSAQRARLRAWLLVDAVLAVSAIGRKFAAAQRGCFAPHL